MAPLALEAMKGENSFQKPVAKYGATLGWICERKQQFQQGNGLFVRKNRIGKSVKKPEKKARVFVNN